MSIGFLWGFLIFCSYVCCGFGVVCPDGLCQRSGGCYLAVGLRVSWIDAWSYCVTLNGTLFTPTDTTMQVSAEHVIKNAKEPMSPGNFWMGFTDLQNPREWKTLDGSVTISYTNWATKVNPKSLDQNCVYMSRKQDFQWNIESCNKKINFICYSEGIKKRVEVYRSYRYVYEYVDADPSSVSWQTLDC